MRPLALLLAIVIGACAPADPAVTTLTLGEAKYRVPDTHIRSVLEEPHQFVRIKPPESNFELVYDSRTAARADQFGWPIIFSLNDKSAPTIERHARGDLVVVCRRAVNPRSGCGLRVTHRGAEWAVLFPSSHFQEAPQIRERALASLNGYLV